MRQQVNGVAPRYAPKHTPFPCEDVPSQEEADLCDVSTPNFEFVYRDRTARFAIVA